MAERLRTHYLDYFIKLKCAPDLLAAKLFPNVKEISETLTAYTAVRRVVGTQRLGDKSITLIDVGSGVNPRTAAFFACMTAWQTIAIDPNLRQSGPHRIRRVEQMKKRIEDVTIETSGLAVIVAVHAHVDLGKTLMAVESHGMIVVAMPCCVPLTLPIEPAYDYEDQACLSKKRRVLIWDLRESNESEKPEEGDGPDLETLGDNSHASHRETERRDAHLCALGAGTCCAVPAERRTQIQWGGNAIGGGGG